MRFAAHIIASALLLPLIGQAADVLPVVTPPTVLPKKEMAEIKPKIPEKKFKIPALPAYTPSLPDHKIEVANYTVEVVTRLQRAAKEVRLLEVWSLDPSIPAAQEKEKKSRPYRFHDYHSLGREELKNKDTAQALLFSVTLSIANGSDETYLCFEPRHGLRIYDQKGFIDVLLCYTCLQGVIYDGKNELWFSTTKDAEVDFDAAFAALGLKKAD